ncbi:hypothetical protein OR1_01318 [Geobacter sp. OR-1]|uniref:hypothetical protein n=1 Tax=Geobacter sp. OR-1 TaxID=1266765 RepID=UPI000542B2F5|nr:hypothetical protein [Geobacter sp. OR-1]GAM09044.1 hypothetical protein OR1_01318 [Geobacter sp. OR-1]
MTHLETHWVNETLELKIAEVRNIAKQLSSENLEELDRNIAGLTTATAELKEIIDAFPHPRG